MVIVCDTREQMMLEIPKVDGVSVTRGTLPIGDYTISRSGQLDTVVVERKSLSDLFSSYTANYENERAKFLKARDIGVEFHLAIEATLSEIRQGHTYWSKGESHTSKKGGLAQIRQLMTITHKYGVPIHFLNGRREMAFWIVEFFLARERVLNEG